MAKVHKGKSAPSEAKTSLGRHGGNRAGLPKKEAEQQPRSSQAAGKDPHRAKAERRRTGRV